MDVRIVIVCVLVSLQAACRADDEIVEVSARGFQSSAGSVYTRWGRGDCPNTATLVYSGIIGGSHWNQRGGASNYLCLHNTPVYEITTSKNNEKRGKIFSTEYEGNFGPFSSLDDHDAPCAVCEAKQRATSLMVPGRNSCPNGWTREFDGYLHSGEYRQYRTEYICVDKHGSDRSGTAGDLFASSRIYPVESKCAQKGGLPCGPYRDAAEVTCVVCTK